MHTNICQLCRKLLGWNFFHEAKLEMWDHFNANEREKVHIISNAEEVGIEFSSSCTWELYPWDPEYSFPVFTGIPPPRVLLALLQEVKGKQQLIIGLVGQFDERLTKYRYWRQIHGGMIGETRMIRVVGQGTFGQLLLWLGKINCFQEPNLRRYIEDLTILLLRQSGSNYKCASKPRNTPLFEILPP